jgi:predicted nuclease of predicted toxin-antitoxin system
MMPAVFTISDFKPPTTGPIWLRAETQGAVIVTKDEDFVDHWILSAQPVALVWIRKGNCSNAALIVWLARLWDDAVSRLERGEKFVELRA